MINVNAIANSIVPAKKDYSWNPSVCICENSRYLKNIVDSVIVLVEIVNIIDSVSTNMTTTISRNVKRTASVHSDDNKVRHEMDCYIFHTLLLVTILLFTIAVLYYHKI